MKDLAFAAYLVSSFGAGLVAMWALESGKDRKQRDWRFYFTLITFLVMSVASHNM